MVKKTKQITKANSKPLPKISQHIKQTFGFLWQEKKLFGVIALSYALIFYLFAGGVTQASFLQFKQAATSLLSNQVDGVSVSTMLLLATVSGEGQNGSGELYTFIGFAAFLVFFLIIIWTARARMAGIAIRIRDSFYSSTGPLIQTIIVFLVIGIQFLPAAVGLYVILLSQAGIWAQNALESAITYGLGILLFAVTLYYLVSSSIASMIVAAPQTSPLGALKAARELVHGRRWNIFLRLFVLIVVLIVIWAVILPAALLLAYNLQIDWLPIVPITLQLLNAFSLVFATVYIYRLYRSLI
ncbi:MAG TPA: hypothetical protein VLA77_02620 [Candidatus Saccharimonadales bacterium]|nr:hypothetical protein [Candidatus Saccharimonadales bacterium]